MSLRSDKKTLQPRPWQGKPRFPRHKMAQPHPADEKPKFSAITGTLRDVPTDLCVPSVYFSEDRRVPSAEWGFESPNLFLTLLKLYIGRPFHAPDLENPEKTRNVSQILSRVPRFASDNVP